MKNIIILFFAVVGLFTAEAQEKKNKNAKHDIEVTGNCDMCKKRIEKAAFSVKGVKSAEWHSDDQTLHLVLNEEKATLLEVEKAVAAKGHDTKNVKATDEDYKNLHGCCKYERKL